MLHWQIAVGSDHNQSPLLMRQCASKDLLCRSTCKMRAAEGIKYHHHLENSFQLYQQKNQEEEQCLTFLGRFKK